LETHHRPHTKVVVVNVLSTTGVLGGVQTAQPSNDHPTFFTPAGYAFSIWGLIYLWMALWVVGQTFFRFRPNGNDVLAITNGRVGVLFFASAVLNCSWLFSWQFLEFWLSCVLMTLYLVTLCVVHVRIPVKFQDFSKNRFDYFVTQVFFSLNLGWICVATVANFAITLTVEGVTSVGEISGPASAVVMISIAAALGLVGLVLNRDIVFCGVLIWAFLAIHNKQTNDVVRNGVVVNVVLLAVGCAVAIADLIRRRVLLRKQASQTLLPLK
jgi:translocator protein